MGALVVVALKVRGDVSSQFLSALLMALPLSGKPARIEVHRPAELPAAGHLGPRHRPSGGDALIAGESWIMHTVHQKGVDSFNTTAYGTGHQWLQAALEDVVATVRLLNTEAVSW